MQPGVIGRLYEKQYPFAAGTAALAGGYIRLGVFCGTRTSPKVQVPLVYVEAYLYGASVSFNLGFPLFGVHGFQAISQPGLEPPQVVDDTNPPLQLDPFLQTFSQIESPQQIFVRHTTNILGPCIRSFSARIVWPGMNPLP